MHSPRLVILADAHLGAAPADDEAAMLRFLDTVPREGDTLLLAGDIFDFWFSYRRLIPRFPASPAWCSPSAWRSTPTC